MLLLTKDVEVIRRLDGLPKCRTVLAMEWQSGTALLACTDEGCAMWNLAALPSPELLFGKQDVCAAAYSVAGYRLALGSAQGQVGLVVGDGSTSACGEACPLTPAWLSRSLCMTCTQPTGGQSLTSCRAMRAR